MLTREEVSQIITLIRRAPLQNMAEAEAAAQLMARLARECPPEVQAEAEVIPIDITSKTDRKRKKLNGDSHHA